MEWIDKLISALAELGGKWLEVAQTQAEAAQAQAQAQLALIEQQLARERMITIAALVGGGLLIAALLFFTMQKRW